MKPYVKLSILILALSSITAQADLGGADYARGQLRSEQAVRLGVVASVRQVNIQGAPGVAGTGIGALVGGLAGSAVGSGGGRVAAEVTGVVAGGIAGALTEQTLTAQTGVEITVQFDTGRLAVIVQAADERFQTGDRVSIIGQPGNLRVTKIDPDSAIYIPAPPPGSAPMPGRVPPAGSAPAGGWSGTAAPVSTSWTGSTTREPAVSGFRWFCPSYREYFPQVQGCDTAWVKVIP